MKKIVSLVLAVLMLLSLYSTVQAEAEKKYDLQGNTVILRMWDSPNPYSEDTSDADKALWLPRYEAIKEAYNCEFEFYTTGTEWDEMPAEWILSVSGSDPAWHVTNNLSAMWLMNLVANNALADVDAAIDTLDIPELFKDGGKVGDHRYAFITSFPGPEGLVFNRAMIAEAGMDYDPGEMFQQGKWDYESFLAYMNELQSKLPEGTYSFFIDPNYWGIFAPPANGGEMVIHTDYTLGLTSDAYIEAFELLEKMIADGLVRPVNRNEAGEPDYWGTPSATFDQGVEVAMTHRAGWQMGGLNSNGLDWGFVPYPWGSAATLTGDDYTSLENSFGSYYDLGVTGAILNGVEVDFPGMDPAYVKEALVNLIYDLIFTDENKAEIASMADPDYVVEPETFFADELSAELYSWLKMHTVYNPVANLNSAGIGISYGGEVSLYDLTRKPFDEGTAIRATFEAAVPEIEASLKDAGLLK